jgi:cardiolipin synthase
MIIKEDIYFDGGHYFDSLLSEIGQAQFSIDLETYIFDNDQLGYRVAQALADTAKRGVHVRVMVDGCGASNWGGLIAHKLEQAGAETRVYHPFPWNFWHWSRSVIKAPLVLKLLFLALHVNKRNHRKTCIIDKQVAYIGSFNITICHLPIEQGGYGWRDTAVRLQGHELTDLLNAFEGAWDHVKLQTRFHRQFQRINVKKPIRLNNSRHRRRVLYKNMLRRIACCKHRLWITNAYFVPDNFLLRHLRHAAQRGVDVRILLPHKSDVFFLPWTSTTFYEQLLKSGVKIFEYLPSMLHAKTVIIDDWMMVGSSNLNYRSLLHDLEVDVVLSHSQAKLHLEQQFLLDIHNAKAIRLDNWIRRPWYQRVLGRILLYIKYWF